MNIISTLNSLPSNKSQINTFFDGVKNSILDGECDPLDVLRQFKCISELQGMFNSDKDIQYQILQEAEKYESKSFEAKNMKIQIKEVGTKYDFTKCGHSGWVNKKQEQEKIVSELKNIESTLKTIKKSSPDLVDAETGEMLRPCAKTSTTKVTVSLI